MAELRKAFEELLAASREAAIELDHAFKVAKGESNFELAPLNRFREAIESAEQALKAHDASAQ